MFFDLFFLSFLVSLINATIFPLLFSVVFPLLFYVLFYVLFSVPSWPISWLGSWPDHDLIMFTIMVTSTLIHSELSSGIAQKLFDFVAHFAITGRFSNFFFKFSPPIAYYSAFFRNYFRNFFRKTIGYFTKSIFLPHIWYAIQHFFSIVALHKFGISDFLGHFLSHFLGHF